MPWAWAPVWAVSGPGPNPGP